MVRADGSLPESHQREAVAHYREESTPLRGSITDAATLKVDLGKALWVPDATARCVVDSSVDIREVADLPTGRTTAAAHRRPEWSNRRVSVRYRLEPAPRIHAAGPDLDASQRSVVEHAGGPLLVLAGPGTGKTTTLVEAVVDRVERRDSTRRRSWC